MGTLVKIFLFVSTGLVYLPLSFYMSKIIYLQVPDEVFSVYKREGIFKTHVVLSIILAILGFLVLRDYTPIYQEWFKAWGPIAIPTLGLLVPVFGYLLNPVFHFVIYHPEPVYKEWLDMNKT